MYMKRKGYVFLPLLLGLLFLSAEFLTAQEPAQAQYVRRFQNGAQLYQLSRFHEATIEFRRAQELAQNINEWSAALYWVILSELAYSDYGSALRDMDELQRHAPNSPYTRDMVYHRARIYFIQGFFEDALFLFNQYISSTTDSDRVTADRRAAAFFWMGESLYAMGQLDEAEKFYAWVVARYPHSPKFEASTYRMDLIKQKRIEAELLALLQLSHEEALRTSEDFQRTIRTYEHTLNIYQRRIAELSNMRNVPQGVQEEQAPVYWNEVDLENNVHEILRENLDGGRNR
jgi:tetratricopeptide (TPR) repeat protein